MKRYQPTKREQQVNLANTLGLHRHRVKSTCSHVVGGVSTEFTFHIPGVFPGTYKLLLKHDGHWFLEYVPPEKRT